MTSARGQAHHTALEVKKKKKKSIVKYGQF